MSVNFFSKLQNYIPNLEEYLNKAGTKDILKKLEETGYKFPNSFREYYLCHDGEKIDIGIFLGLKSLTVEEMLKHWNMNKQFHQECTDYGLISFESKKIKEEYFNPNWFPIAYDRSGNYIGIDFSPDENGTFGQVINFGRDESEMFVISNSFEEFLIFVLNQYECGKCIFKNSHEQGQAYISWNNNRHFFDDLKGIVVSGSSHEKNEDFHLFWIQLSDEWKEVVISTLGCEPKHMIDLYKITNLSLLNSNVTNLEPLLHFKQLRKLVASKVQSTDFSPVSSLDELRILYLAKTNFSNIEVLVSLKKLKELYLGNSSISDIKTISQIDSLQSLSLENLIIEDLSPLLECRKLRILDLSGVKTKELNIIGSITNLLELNISNIELEDLSFLGNLVVLKSIQLDSCDGDDYSVFSKLTHIENITCPFDVFMKTKGLYDRKISYTICGHMNEEEKLIYSNYVSSEQKKYDEDSPKETSAVKKQWWMFWK